jgi:hypothetical protein
MKVVNERKWRRAKWQFTGLLTVLLFWAMGGLESADFNNKGLAFLLLPSIALMTLHLTKDWICNEQRSQDWYD